jgi:hypothetical protein
MFGGFLKPLLFLHKIMQSIKTTLYIFVFLFISFGTLAQRQKIDFDANWKFHFGHTANPEKDFNYSIQKGVRIFAGLIFKRPF